MAVNVDVNFWGTMSCSLIKGADSLHFYCRKRTLKVRVIPLKHCFIAPDSCCHIPEDYV
jgi:hypothetical protein